LNGFDVTDETYTVLLSPGQRMGELIRVPVKLGVGEAFVEVAEVAVVGVAVVAVGPADDVVLLQFIICQLSIRKILQARLRLLQC
jgi:hypothetical protein